MLAKVDAEAAHPVTLLAVRILALTAVRPGTLAETLWSEWNDLDQADPVWRIPAERMKLKLHHKEDETAIISCLSHVKPLKRSRCCARSAVAAPSPSPTRDSLTSP